MKSSQSSPASLLVFPNQPETSQLISDGRRASWGYAHLLTGEPFLQVVSVEALWDPAGAASSKVPHIVTSCSSSCNCWRSQSSGHCFYPIPASYLEPAANQATSFWRSLLPGNIGLSKRPLIKQIMAPTPKNLLVPPPPEKALPAD